MARLDSPAGKKLGDVGYSKTAGSFGALADRALDLVEGPYSQRALRQEREAAGGGPTYAEVMSELRGGAHLKVVEHVKRRLLEEGARLGIVTTTSPGFAHLAPVDPRAVAALEPWERQLLTNGAGRFCSSAFEVESYVHNGISLALHAAMRDDATIDPGKLSGTLGPTVLDVLGIATARFSSRDPALQHWASGARSPYEPDDRPLTTRDLRDLRRKDPALFGELIEAAPIPTTLPVLDAAAAGNEARLDDYVVVMVQHALGSIVPFTDKLMEKGVSPSNIEFVPVPYSTNAIVSHVVQARGISMNDSCPEGHIAPRDVEKIMERDVKRALDAALAKADKTGKKMLIIDDGGIVVRLLSGRAKTLTKTPEEAREYGDWVQRHASVPIRVVEQTTRGITEALAVGELPKNITLVDMARSEAKDFEGPMIGKDAHVVLDAAMRDVGKGGIKDREVVLLGYGTIGGNVARAMREVGARVTIYDIGDEGRAKAEADGFPVASTLREALAGKDLVVGCTGHRSVQREDFLALKRGAVIASLSSKAMEFFTDHLDGTMSGDLYRAQGHGEAPVASYGRAFKHHQVVDSHDGEVFGQALFYLVNSGCPATFTGHVNCVPPEDIQLTEAIKLEAVMQAAGSDVGHGIVPLEVPRQQRVLTAMDNYRPGWR